MEYRRHEQPGCGGCFLLLLLLIFLLGGVKGLGLLAFLILFFLLSGIGAFWAFTFYVKRQISAYERSQSETHNTFVHLLVNILVKIAQVDGKVSREEVKTIRHFF
ncbi:MAG: J domain-containing protein, partial [Desulfobulbaceae bacterium]|nr:J domain-containing protein [Desulfobulbaceae bacterium]